MCAPPSQQWFSAAHTGLKFSKPAMIFGRKSRGPPAFTACTSWVCLKIKRSGFVPALSRQASLSQRLNHTNFIIYQMGHKNQFFVRNRWNYFLARRHCRTSTGSFPAATTRLIDGLSPKFFYSQRMRLRNVGKDLFEYFVIWRQNLSPTHPRINRMRHESTNLCEIIRKTDNPTLLWALWLWSIQALVRCAT